MHPKPKVTLGLRVDLKLHSALCRLAEQHKASLNVTCERLLAESIERKGE